MSVLEREQPLTKIQTPSTLREVLHRAADLLEEFGWMQGDFGSKEEGAFCGSGAVEVASNELGFDFDGPIFDGLLWPTYCCRRLGKAFCDWNDEASRTKSEAVAKLREWADHPEATKGKAS